MAEERKVLQHTAEQLDEAVEKVLDDTFATNTDLQKKVNPNLLDNWHFGNLVNQRGQTSYSGNGYTIDRWILGDIWTVGKAALSVNDGYITLQEGLFQRKELKRSKMNGRVLSVSALFADGTLGHGVIHLPDEIVIGASYTDGVSTSHGCVRYISEDILEYRIEASGNQYVAVKLELGDQQTLAHQENGNWVLNEIPDYGEQLARCQRYYNVIKAVSVNSRYGYGIGAGDNICVFVPINVPLRAVPSISTNGDFFAWAGSTAYPATFRAFDSISTNGVTFSVTTSDMTAGRVFQLLDAGTGNSAIILDANL